MIRVAFAVLLLMVWALPSATRADAPSVRRFALVIGNNQPVEPTSSKLRYADDDAVSTHRMLRDAGVDSLLLVTLDDDSRSQFGGVGAFGAPRTQALEKAFSELVSRMDQAHAAGEKSEFLFFYSGHGDVEHGEGFLALEDGRLTRTKLFQLLSRSKATRNHVFIDACKSYFLAFDRGPGGRRTPYQGAMVEALPAQLGNTGFVLSTSSDRDSHEWERYQGGILSHELRSALRGAADVNLDAHISYAELGAFLSTANQGIKNARLRPDFMVRPPNHDFEGDVLAWPDQEAPLSFGGQTFGHFYVETSTGERILDAHPALGQALSLWTPKERPLFVRKSDGSAEYVLTSSAPMKIAALDPAKQEIASRGAAGLAFERLFAVPFGERDVLGFRPPPVRERDDSDFDHARKDRIIRIASGSLSLAGFASGIAMTSLALVHANRADRAPSQVVIDRENDKVLGYDVALAGCFAVGTAAGAVWLWKRFGKGSLSLSPTFGRASGLMLEARQRF
jgi:hypothetical protein